MDKLGDLAAAHWSEALIALATFFLGRWWGRWRAARELSRKEFRHRLNFSLNHLDGDTLKIRTLRECNLADVWFNAVMCKEVRKVADKTTVGQPILPFSDEDRWHYLNVILNEVSEMCAVGLLRKDAGGAPHTARYVICLTNERDGDMRTWKVRAMVVREDTLERVHAMAAEGATPQFESPHHATRWRTLQVIAARRLSHPQEMLAMEIAV